jgi:hypothetical protein
MIKTNQEQMRAQITIGLEEMEAIAEHQEVPDAEAAVETIGALDD